MKAPLSSDQQLLQAARQALASEILVSAPPMKLVDGIQRLIEAVMANTCQQAAIANLISAVGGVLAYDYCDCDDDVVEAIERLRKAAEDYGTVQRLST
jgi:hypothetical protein